MFRHRYRIREIKGVRTGLSVFFIEKQFLGLRILPFISIRDKHTRKKKPLRELTEAIKVSTMLAEEKVTTFHTIKQN